MEIYLIVGNRNSCHNLKHLLIVHTYVHIFSIIYCNKAFLSTTCVHNDILIFAKFSFVLVTFPLHFKAFQRSDSHEKRSEIFDIFDR